MTMHYLSSEQCQLAAHQIGAKLLERFRDQTIFIYGVPRGGVPVSYLVRTVCPPRFCIAAQPETADVFVDDISASGNTRNRYVSKFSKPFFCLTDFLEYDLEDGVWVVFPWEQTEQGIDTSAEDIVIRLLQYIGENPKRGGLCETPQRVLNAWKEWTSGYGQDPKSVLKCFKDGSENYNEMVIVKDLPFYSQCEHHLASFFGTATIAYIPHERVVGLSKLGRVLEIFSRRLQVQERLTTQIADAINENLQPKGVGVLLKARHLCMESRGIATQGHETITCAIRGCFSIDKVRAEFLSIAKG